MTLEGLDSREPASGNTPVQDITALQVGVSQSLQRDKKTEDILCFTFDTCFNVLFSNVNRPKPEQVKKAMQFAADRFDSGTHPLAEFAYLFNLQSLHTEALSENPGPLNSYLGPLLSHLEKLKPIVLSVPEQRGQSVVNLILLGNQAAARGELGPNFCASPEITEWVAAYAKKLSDYVVLAADGIPGRIQSSIILAMSWIDQTSQQLGKYVLGSEASGNSIVLGITVVKEIGQALAVSLISHLVNAGFKKEIEIVDTKRKIGESDPFEHSRFNACRKSVELHHDTLKRSGRYLMDFLSVFEQGIDSWKLYLKYYQAIQINLGRLEQFKFEPDYRALRESLPNKSLEGLEPNHILGSVLIDYPGVDPNSRICVGFNRSTNINTITYHSKESQFAQFVMFGLDGHPYVLNSSIQITQCSDGSFCGFPFERFSDRSPAIALREEAFSDLIAQAKGHLAMINAVCHFKEDEFCGPLIISFQEDGVYLIYRTEFQRLNYLKDIDLARAEEVAESLANFVDFSGARIFGCRLRQLSGAVELAERQLYYSTVTSASTYPLRDVLELAVEHNSFPVLKNDQIALSCKDLGIDLNLSAQPDEIFILDHSSEQLSENLQRISQEHKQGKEFKPVILTKEMNDWLNSLKYLSSVEHKEILHRLSRLSLNDLGEFDPAYDPDVRGLLELKIRIGGGVRIYIRRSDQGFLVLLAARNKDDQSNDIINAADIFKRDGASSRSIIGPLAKLRIRLVD